MHNPPSRTFLALICAALLIMIGLSPTGVALAAVNENFDGFPDDAPAETLTIPGIASIASTPADSTTILNFVLPAPFAGKSLANLTTVPAPADGTALITFTQPQDTYNFDFLVNFGNAASQFIVQGSRDGANVFTHTYAAGANVTPFVANGTGVVFDQIGIISDAGHWAIDNLQTTDAAPGITLIQTGPSTDVAETGPTSDTFTIALDAPPSDTVTIDILTDGQCSAAPGSITFAANQVAAQTITITAVDDGSVEAAVHPCNVNFPVSAAAVEYGAATLPDLTVNVTDNDTPGFTVTPLTLSLNEGDSGTYDISINTVPSADVTIDITPDAAQCTTSTNSITFTTASVTTQTITVTATDDLVGEASPHNCLITHAMTTTDPNYVGLTVDDVTVEITDNDVAGITVDPLNVSIAEGGVVPATYSISLDMEPVQPITIDMTVADGQCTVNPPSITFPVGGVGPLAVDVTAVDDAVVEGAHNCTIAHTLTTTDPAYIGFTVPDVIGNITDNDIPGVTIDPMMVNVTEGGATDTYTVVLNTQPTAAVTVTITPDAQCTVNGGTAPINLTFNPAAAPLWNTAQTVTVGAVDDAIAEGTHNCTITHQGASADANYNVVFGDVTGTITDNDAAGVTLTPTAVNVAEGGATDTYTVVLDSQPTAAVTITITPDAQCTVNGGTAPINLTFNPAAVPLWNAAQTVTVGAVDDAIVEGTHNCTITHQGASGDANYNVAFGNVTGTITDNDIGGVTLTPTAVNVAEGGATADYTVVLDSQPTAAVTITITPDAQCTVNGSTAPINLTFNPAAAPLWNVAQTVTVSAVDDVVVEGAHNCTITHQGASGDANYNVAFGNVTGAITDNDIAGVTLNPTAVTVTEAGATASYTVVLDSQPTAAVTITITPDTQCTVNGSAVAITLTFNPAAAPLWNVAQTVTVEAVDDVLVEGPHSCTITHQGTSADANYNVAFGTVTGTITDNDAAGVTIAPTTVNVAEGGATADYTVVLDGQPTAVVTITVTPDAQCTVNGSAAPITLTFNPAAAPLWSTPQTVTVAAVDDLAVEGAHNCTITHQGTSADANYNAAFGDVTGTITDNDVTGVTLNPTTVTVAEGGGVDTYDVVLNAQPTAPVTITITPDTQCTVNTSAAPITLTFNPAAAPLWNVPQSVTVGAVDDALVEGTHNCTITHQGTSADANYNIAFGNVVGTITDNDTAGVTINPTAVAVAEGGATAAYTFVLNSQPTGTVTITVTPDAQCTVNGSAVAITLTFNPAAAPLWNTPQTVTVGAVDDALVEGTHNCTITHQGTSADANYNIAFGNVVGTITDNDTAGAPSYSSNPLPSPALGSTINVATTVGTNISATISVLEVGGADLVVGPITVAGSPQLTLNSAANFTIVDGNGSQNISILCNAGSVGNFTTTVTVPHNGTTGLPSPAVYTVICDVTSSPTPRYASNPTAPNAAINMSTTLGNGVSSALNVNNSGGGTLNVSSVTLTGSGTSQISVVGPSSFTLTSGATQALTIQCAGTALGTFNATLTLIHNGTAPPASPVVHAVSCTVTSTAGSPGYGSNPSPGSVIDVGTVLINTPITRTLNVFETGGAQLEVRVPSTGVVLGGANANEFRIIAGFAQTNQPAGTVLFTIADGGAPVSVVIQCQPTQAGLRQATLTFGTNAPGAGTVTYTLICTGSLTPVATGTAGVIGIPTPVTPLAPTAIPFVPATGVVVEVTGLAVRSGPYLGASLLNVARPGNTYNILAKSNDEGPYTWYLIQVGKITGWVSGKYLEVAGSVDTIPFSGSIFDQIDGAPDIGVRLTTDAIIDMRRRPSPRTTIVITIPAGAEVIVLGRTIQERTTFWLHVSYNGVVGWIPSLPVSMRGPSTTLPSW